MNCPRCQTVVLVEREREGLLVDACTSCRGVWLDRGELEKLISRALSELDELAARREHTPPRGGRHRDDDDRPRHDDDRHYPKRKRSWIESLSEIFD